METRTDHEAREKIWEMIKDIDFAMMVTLDAEGRLRGRPMSTNKHEGGDVLWFFTETDSPKNQEIQADGRVLLSYADPSKQNYVSVGGRAEVVRDVEKQKQLWSEPLRAWFPNGPEAPEVSLLKVTATGAEYWDAPSSTFLHAYGYVKSVLTGTPPMGADSAKVDFPA